MNVALVIAALFIYRKILKMLLGKQGDHVRDVILKTTGLQDDNAHDPNKNPLEDMPKSNVGKNSLLNEEKIAKKPSKVDKLKKKVDSILNKARPKEGEKIPTDEEM